MTSIVVHYQEIALKGNNRPWFIARLVRNLREATADLGVRQVTALMGRIELVLGPTALLYVAAALALRGARAVRAEIRPRTAFAGVGMLGAYGLALAALSKAPAPAVAAVRETSVVIAAGLAAVFLHEPVGAGRAAGAATVAAGIATIALG